MIFHYSKNRMVNAKFGKLLIDQKFSLLEKFQFSLNVLLLQNFNLKDTSSIFHYSKNRWMLNLENRLKFFIVQKTFPKHFYYPLLFSYSLLQNFNLKDSLIFHYWKNWLVNAKFGKFNGSKIFTAQKIPIFKHFDIHC